MISSILLFCSRDQQHKLIGIIARISWSIHTDTKANKGDLDDLVWFKAAWGYFRSQSRPWCAKFYTLFSLISLSDEFSIVLTGEKVKGDVTNSLGTGHEGINKAKK